MPALRSAVLKLYNVRYQLVVVIVFGFDTVAAGRVAEEEVPKLIPIIVVQSYVLSRSVVHTLDGLVCNAPSAALIYGVLERRAVKYARINDLGTASECPRITCSAQRVALAVYRFVGRCRGIGSRIYKAPVISSRNTGFCGIAAVDRSDAGNGHRIIRVFENAVICIVILPLSMERDRSVKRKLARICGICDLARSACHPADNIGVCVVNAGRTAAVLFCISIKVRVRYYRAAVSADDDLCSVA